MEVSSEVSEFLRILEKWSDLSSDWNNANTKSLNKLHNQYHSIFKSLRDQNRLHEIIPFIDHSNKTVSSVIATYCLIQNETLAVKRLKELSSEEGLIGMGAKSNLDQWAKGELTFDY